jgi:hypothetical protein
VAIYGTTTSSDSLRAATDFALRLIRLQHPTVTRPPLGSGGPLQFHEQPCPHSAPSTPGGSSALQLQALHAFHGLRPNGSGLGSSLSQHCWGPHDDAAGFTSHTLRTADSSAPFGPVSRRFAGRVSPGGGRQLSRWLGPSLCRSCPCWLLVTSLDAHPLEWTPEDWGRRAPAEESNMPRTRPP